MEDSRAAASSKASGMPSRRRQIEATRAATDSSRTKAVSRDRARSANRRTASEACSSSTESAPAGGSESDGTR